jgi:hypothetical protein
VVGDRLQGFAKFNSSVIKRPLLANFYFIERENESGFYIVVSDYSLTRDRTSTLEDLGSFCADDKVSIWNHNVLYGIRIKKIHPNYKAHLKTSA